MKATPDRDKGITASRPTIEEHHEDSAWRNDEHDKQIALLRK